MVIGKRHHAMFDELGDDGLVDMANLICREEYGETGLVPYPSKGRDGGVDGKHVAETSGKPNIQAKWREVATYDDRPLRTEIHKTYKAYLADCRVRGRTGKVIFITNVRRTAGDIKNCEAAEADYSELSPEYWDFAKLWHFMVVYPEIKDKMLPQYTSRELKRMKEELDQRAAVQARKDKEQLRQTPEFKAAALKLKRTIIDPARLDSQYLGFVYLAEPLYVDDQDGARAVVREMFTIDNETEQEAVDRLKATGCIDITGNVITVADVAAEQAQAAAGEIVTHMGADLEKILTLIQGA